jgi:hypothetical protein
MSFLVCDFIQVIGDEPLLITNTTKEVNFDTLSRYAQHTALLIFNVKGLNSTVPVLVNNTKVGWLTPIPLQSGWFTQMVALKGNVLKDGTNELQLQAAPSDNFDIKDVMCFFGQLIPEGT